MEMTDDPSCVVPGAYFFVCVAYLDLHIMTLSIQGRFEAGRVQAHHSEPSQRDRCLPARGGRDRFRV